MGAATAISIEDYLKASFPNPDPEYRDGEIVERSIPDYLHGKVQGLIGEFFLMLRNKFPLFPSTGTRVRLGLNKVLIPDVSVFYQNEPPPLPLDPPLIVIEILSPDDRLSAVREKLAEYRAWGVPHVWLVDPHSRRLYACGPGFAEVASLRVPELEIELKPADAFDWP